MTIGNIGIGLFILIIVWICALAVFVVSVKYQSNVGWITLLSAAAITIILIAIPTENQLDPKKIEQTEEKDYLLVYKKILLAFLILSGILGLFSVFIFHCIEPIRVKPIKSFS